MSPKTALALHDDATSHHFAIENNLFVSATAVDGRTMDWTGTIDDGVFDYDGYFPDGIFDFHFGASGYQKFASFAEARAAQASFEPHGVVLGATIFASGLGSPGRLQDDADAARREVGRAVERRGSWDGPCQRQRWFQRRRARSGRDRARMPAARVRRAPRRDGRDQRTVWVRFAHGRRNRRGWCCGCGRGGRSGRCRRGDERKRRSRWCHVRKRRCGRSGRHARNYDGWGWGCGRGNVRGQCHGG